MHQGSITSFSQVHFGLNPIFCLMYFEHILIYFYYYHYQLLITHIINIIIIITYIIIAITVGELY